jgi:hypothetical protein
LKGEIISITKTLLTAKGRTSSGGAFIQSKEKHLKQGGESFKILRNAFLKSHSYTIGYLQKNLKGLLQKICKNKLCGANVVQNY